MTEKRREVLLIACLCLGVGIVFLPALRGEFTNWDDTVNVTENPLVRGGVRDGLFELMARPYLRLYIPFTYSVFWVEFHLWGENPLGYHIVNILCHTASALLVFLIFNRLLARRWIAFAAALWWGIHPLHVEPVAWVTGLKDVLAALLAVLCWWLYILGCEFEAAKARRSRLMFRASLLVFLLACLSKPAVVTFPLVLLGYAWFLTEKRRRPLFELLPFFVVSVAVAVLTIAVHRPEESAILPITGIWDRLRLAADSSLFYVSKASWPSHLCPVYPRMISDVLGTPVSWFELIMVLAIGVAALILPPRWRLGLLIYAASLAPVSGIVPFGYQVYSSLADRYAYLPAVGLALILGDILLRCGDFAKKRAERWRVPMISCFVVWIVVLGSLTWKQAFVWKDSMSVWGQVMKYNPAPPAPIISNYGNAFFVKGELDEAVRWFERCVREADWYSKGHYNLGCAYKKLGRTEDAIFEFHQALEREPTYTSALVNLSALMLAMARYQEAERYARRALELAPQDALAALNLAQALSGQGQHEEAFGIYRAILAGCPTNYETRLLFAYALVRAGQQESARREFLLVANAPLNVPQWVKDKAAAEAAELPGNPN